MDLKKEVFGQFLSKIYVDGDDEIREHVLDINLKLPLFNDKLKYRDEKISINSSLSILDTLTVDCIYVENLY